MAVASGVATRWAAARRWGRRVRSAAAVALVGGRPGSPPPGTGAHAARPGGGRRRAKCGGATRRRLDLHKNNSAMFCDTCLSCPGTCLTLQSHQTLDRLKTVPNQAILTLRGMTVSSPVRELLSWQLE